MPASKSIVHRSLTTSLTIKRQDMATILIRSIVVILLLFIASLILAVEPKVEQVDPRGYVCLKAPTPPKIDGQLDDEAWKRAPWSEEFVDIEGTKKPKPRYRTRMKMLWDDNALYIAAEIEEPHIWGTLSAHDSVIFQDPDFEVFIDPDGDNHMYGELELNAKNTTWDLLLTKPYKDGGKAVNGWEIIGLKTAVHIDGTLNDSRDLDKSWTLEIAWPWEGLREMSNVSAPPKEGEAWRINFSRVEWDVNIESGKYVKVKGKPEHNWVWSPQGVVDMHRPDRWGYLQFSAKSSAKVDYLPDPAQRVKDRLHEVYYAQHEYYKKHGKYTSRIADLGIENSDFGVLGIELFRSGFEATLTAPKKAGSKRWGIKNDSYLWRQ